MKNVLEEFINEMEFIKKFMNFEKNSQKYYFNSSHSSEESRSLSIAKIKQYNFNTYIISIYGAYEKFIEKMMEEYLKKICNNVKYFSELPSNIQKNNLSKTMDIIKQIEYPKYKHLKSNSLIEILHRNMNENYPYINIDAFKGHTANFGINIIDTYFSSIEQNVISKKVINYSPLKEYLENKYTHPHNLKNSIIFSIINHTCDMRNNIAHGANIENILDRSIVNEYIDFFILFSKSLCHLLIDSSLKFLFSLKEKTFKPIRIFEKNIIFFNTKGINLNQNNKIIAFKNNNLYPQYFLMDILEIRINNNTVNNVINKEPTDISINVNQEINKNINFTIV